MKRIIKLFWVTVILVLTGCWRDAVVDHHTKNGDWLSKSILDLTVAKEAEITANNDQISAAVLDLLVASSRDFGVTNGELGYFSTRILEHFQDVLPYRIAFSDREQETASWILALLAAMGFTAEQIMVQPFKVDVVTSSWWHPPAEIVELFASRGYYDDKIRVDESKNIILTIPGHSDTTIIVGAHYDSVNVPGISDNAAGVAVLLETIYRLRNEEPYYTLKFIFTGAHEYQVAGLFYFVDNLPTAVVDNLLLFINVDNLLCGPEQRFAIGALEWLPEIPANLFWQPDQRPTVVQNDLTMQITGIATVLNTTYETFSFVSEPRMIFQPGDHSAFLQLAIPVMFMRGTYPVVYPILSSSTIWHSPLDNLDFIMNAYPGLVEQALTSFGRFLELVLLGEF